MLADHEQIGSELLIQIVYVKVKIPVLTLTAHKKSFSPFSLKVALTCLVLACEGEEA